MERADNFIRTVDKPESEISAQIDATRIANIEKNRALLRTIAKAM